MDEIIKLIRSTSVEYLNELITSVQPMHSINLGAMCDEDYGIDVTWMMIHGYKKVITPMGKHGLLKCVNWVKK